MTNKNESNWADIFFLETLLLPQTRDKVKDFIKAFEDDDNETLNRLMAEQKKFANEVFGEDLPIDTKRVVQLICKVHKIAAFTRLKLMREREDGGADSELLDEAV
jgi:hypothetical protein